MSKIRKTDNNTNSSDELSEPHEQLLSCDLTRSSFMILMTFIDQPNENTLQFLATVNRL